MTDYCQLARQALHTYLSDGDTYEPDQNAGARAGCFVSLHTREGDLRGCIGTIQPRYFDLHDEIVENAIAAGTRDPRFPPVSLNELASLTLDVSVLKEPEPVNGLSELDPQRYGVIIRNGRRRGVLLPGLDGVDSVDQQLSITRRKAGIGEAEPIEISRFEVEKFFEPAHE
ncbi:AmmeMemoRadiSam system protein A [Acanthopleuribacter pedis]|uniref:AmmeMemoRadiSam system protein A n=1 Tax=Acanthopleuribacter pedis TaxID=442870 RepID=A0A8J7U717_9BACT|nr:AmmeMemoRadiSam system protein A [Acanthopleuribacter pedis]MBO1320946.1 AmmeMemoRadiSam system protein A [Acanthopleuribacter pedis]